MGKRVSIVIVLIALVGGLVFWFARDPDPDPGEPATETSSDRSELLARKRAARAEKDMDLRPCSVSGRVVEVGGEGIPGAVVRLVEKPGRRSPPTGEVLTPTFVVADAQGNWSIPSVTPGTYLISATAEQHQPGQVDGVELRPANEHEGIEIALERGGLALTGTVSDYGGGGIEGVLVSARGRVPLASPQSIRPVYGTLTDAEGHYTLWLADARYNLSTWHVDYVEADEWVEMKGSAQTRDFKLVPGGVVEGTVIKAADGSPVADAQVTIAEHRPGSFGGSFQGMLHTDSAGKFTFRQLKAGVQTLRATAPGLATVTPTEVPLAIAEQVADVVVTVDAAFDVSGFVVRKEDPEQGVPDVTVRVFGMRQGGQYNSLPTGDDGYFVLHGVAPGSYMGSASGPGILGDFMSGTRITIEAEPIDDLLFEVEFGAEIRGRVEPATAVNVRLEPVEDEGGMNQMRRMMGNTESYSQADGSFRLVGAKEGRWKLVATAVEGDGKGELVVEVPADGLDGVVISLEDRPRVTGHVVDRDGSPLPEVRVVLVDQAESAGTRRRRGRFFGATGNSAETQSDGSFEVVHVEDGTYAVKVVADREALELEGADVDTAGIPLSIQDGTGVDGLTLRALVRRGSITGTVTAIGGGPAPDVWVKAQRETGEGPRWFGGEDPALTDVDGRFAFDGLEEGAYVLTAEAADGGARAELEDVQLGDDVSVQLEAPARITGTVVHQGTPVTDFMLESGMGMMMGMGFGGRRIVDPQGKFSLERLTPGEHVVLVSSDDGSARASIELEAGEHEELQLELVGWGKITGTAISVETGEPVSGVTVAAFSSGGMKRADAELFDLIKGGGNETDKAGRFEVEGLGGGLVRMSFTTGGLMDSQELGGTAVYLEPGESLDIGQVRLLEEGEEIPEDEQGDLGMDVDTAYDRPTEDDPRGKTPGSKPEGRARLWVVRVFPNGPAAKAGIEAFTEILAVDGKSVEEVGTRTASVLLGSRRIKKGQKVKLRLEGNESVTLEAD